MPKFIPQLPERVIQNEKQTDLDLDIDLDINKDIEKIHHIRKE